MECGGIIRIQSGNQNMGLLGLFILNRLHDNSSPYYLYFYIIFNEKLYKIGILNEKRRKYNLILTFQQILPLLSF